MKRRLVWALYARAYDAINHNVPYVKMLNEVLAVLDVTDTASNKITILDAGCGTGNLEMAISQSSQVQSVLGIDSSPEMLNRAKVKFNQNQVIHFQVADLNKQLSFSDATFDRVVSINALYAVDNPEYTLRELFRVLKTGGKIVCANPHDRSSFFGIMRGQYREQGFGRFLFGFIRYLPALLVIMFVNLLFLRNNANYWNESATSSHLQTAGFHDIALRPTYAGHDILATAIK